ncbi:hypothetical protein BaRGS_00006511 [Batillaria attramentaria]|uniref:Uncharacterized protein n=1 Tax=Batillaria attramentaria TaxID=370345 RepID=A0ABD0LS38_9CAEN
MQEGANSPNRLCKSDAKSRLAGGETQAERKFHVESRTSALRRQTDSAHNVVTLKHELDSNTAERPNESYGPTVLPGIRDIGAWLYVGLSGG